MVMGKLKARGLEVNELDKLKETLVYIREQNKKMDDTFHHRSVRLEYRAVARGLTIAINALDRQQATAGSPAIDAIFGKACKEEEWE